MGDRESLLEHEVVRLREENALLRRQLGLEQQPCAAGAQMSPPHGLRFLRLQWTVSAPAPTAARSR